MTSTAVSFNGLRVAAFDYGRRVAGAFDMHRLMVLEALALPRPKTVLEEKMLWAEVAAIQTWHEVGEHLVYQEAASQ